MEEFEGTYTTWNSMGMYETSINSPYINPYTGLPVERSPDEYRHNFDEYLQWKHPDLDLKEATGRGSVVYTDRMERSKLKALEKKYFGDISDDYSRRSPEKIQEMLRKYYEDPGLLLTAVIASCNVSTGHRLWAFIWKPSKGWCAE